MLSNSCKYGLRAVIYIASQPKGEGQTGIKQISKDLNLPRPFLAKILQELAKHKILNSVKGPHGGFSLMKDPQKISLLDIVKTIDGDEIFTSCVVRNCTCADAEKENDPCPLHDHYAGVRSQLIDLFSSTTIHDLAAKNGDSGKLII